MYYSLFSGNMAARKSYVILIGDVGAGKSTLVEKMTGITGISSAGSNRATKTSEAFELADCSLIICDTPGTNSVNDSFQCNVEIARALNFLPVNLVLITVKASVRIDTVVATVREYMERFVLLELPMELIRFCITHMDTVDWEEDKLTQLLKNSLGNKKTIFSSPRKESLTLVTEIKAECLKTQEMTISVGSALFSRLFEIDKHQIKSLKETLKEVSKIKPYFYGEQNTEDEENNTSSEFQTWMYDNIDNNSDTQTTSSNSSFSAYPEIVTVAGHIANLSSQLHPVLTDMKIGAMKYHVNVESDFGNCPYCRKLWQKVEGWEGETENVKYESEC